MRLYFLPLVAAAAQAGTPPNSHGITHHYLVEKGEVVRRNRRVQEDTTTMPPDPFRIHVLRKAFGSDPILNLLYEDVEQLFTQHAVPVGTATQDFLKRNQVPHECKVDNNIFCLARNPLVTDEANMSIFLQTQSVIVNTERDPALNAYIQAFMSECKHKTPQERVSLIMEYVRDFFEAHPDTPKASKPIYLSDFCGHPQTNSMHYALLTKLLADHVDYVSCRVIVGKLRDSLPTRHVWTEIIASEAGYTRPVSGLEDGLVQKSPEDMRTIFEEWRRTNDDIPSKPGGTQYMVDAARGHMIRLSREVYTEHPTLGRVLTWKKNNLKDTHKSILTEYGSVVSEGRIYEVNDLRKALINSYQSDALKEHLNVMKAGLLKIEETPHYSELH